MEETTCNKCDFIELIEDYLWCPILNKRIFQLNLEYQDPLCNAGRIKKRALILMQRKPSKLKSLRAVFTVLGVPDTNRDRERRARKKTFRGDKTIYRRYDGTYKSKTEIMDELEGHFRRAIKLVHPDINPHRYDAKYYNLQTKILNEAYERGQLSSLIIAIEFPVSF